MTITNEVNEIFQKLPAAFLPEKAGNLTAVLQLELTGEGGGYWILKVAGGKLAIDQGSIDTADLTLTMEASDYIALTRGEVQPMSLFMAGKVQLQGDVELALKFQEMFARS